MTKVFRPGQDARDRARQNGAAVLCMSEVTHFKPCLVLGKELPHMRITLDGAPVLAFSVS